MRCTCCGRAINPARAYTVHTKATGVNYSSIDHYGPVCAVRLGLMKQSPPMKRKPSRFAIFSKTNPVRVEDGQEQLFGVTA